MVKKLLLLILLVLVLISPAYAILQIYSYDDSTQTATIADWIGLSKVAEVQLIDNTNQCLIDCSATLKITPYKDFTDTSYINFYKDMKGKSIGYNIDYEIYIQEKEKYIEQVPYQDTCTIDTYDNKTGKVTGQEKVACTKYKEQDAERDTWTLKKDLADIKFTKGEPVYIKLNGKKSIRENVDWIPTIYNLDIKELAWWNSSWNYKRQINLSTASGYTGINYQVGLNITYDSDMQADFDDLRFVNNSENTELPYWIESKSNSNWAYVWVKADQNITNTNSTIYMYYGNPSTITTSTANTTFDLYDNASVDNTANYNHWYAGTNGNALSWNTSGWYQTNGSKNGEFNFWYQGNLNGNYHAKIEIQQIDTSNGCGGIVILANRTTESAGGYGVATILDPATCFADGNNLRMLKIKNNGYSLITKTTQGQDTNWHTLGLSKYGTNYTTYYDNSTANYATDTDDFVGGGIGFESNAINKRYYFRNLIVRKYIYPEPISYFGAEQKAPNFDVILNLPEGSTTIYDNRNINFNFTGNSSSDTTFSCKIHLDDTLNQTNATTLNNTLTNFLINGIEFGNHTWFINCTDSITTVLSQNRTFALINTTPAVTIISPENITYNTGSITLNTTATTNGTLASVWYSLDSGANTTIPGGWIYQETADTIQTVGYLSHPTKGVDGDWNTYTGGVNTSEGAYYLNYTKPIGAKDTSLWMIKGVESGAVRNTTNTSILSSCWNYDANKISFKSNMTTVQAPLNFCLNASGWQLLKGFASGGFYEEAIWWDSDYAVGLSVADGSHNVIVYANSTVGALGSAHQFFSTDTTPPTSTLITPNGGISAAQIEANFTCTQTDNISLKNVTLWWDSSGSWAENGTTSITGLSNSTAFDRTFNVSVNPVTWNCYVCDNADNCAFAPANYTIYSLPFNVTTGACGAGYIAAQNYTFKDDTTLSNLNGINVNLIVQYGSIVNNSLNTYNTTLTGISSLAICINATYAPYYIGYGELQYLASGYADRRHYLFTNSTLTNTTEYLVEYMLNSSYAVAFQFTFTDSALSIYSGYYSKLLKWYPALNSYNEVDMGKTDVLGQTINYLRLNDVDYRIALYFTNGTLVKLTDPAVRFSCASAPCSYTIKVDTASNGELSEVYGVQQSLSYSNTTKYFSYLWSDPSGNTNSMILQVHKQAGDGDILICNSTVNGATGSASCNTSGYTGILTADVYRTTATSIGALQAQETVQAETTLFTGLVGLFIGLILFIVIMLIGLATSPLAAIVMSVIGLIPAVALGAVPVAVLMAVAAIGAVLMHVFKRVS